MDGQITVITDPVETLKAQNAQMYNLLCGLRGKEHALDPLEPVKKSLNDCTGADDGRDRITAEMIERGARALAAQHGLAAVFHNPDQSYAQTYRESAEAVLRAAGELA